jgi:hypothetical protein
VYNYYADKKGGFGDKITKEVDSHGEKVYKIDENAEVLQHPAERSRCPVNGSEESI